MKIFKRLKSAWLAFLDGRLPIEIYLSGHEDGVDYHNWREKNIKPQPPEVRQ